MKWLFLGYSVIWVAIFLYLLGLHRRQAALEREVNSLKAVLGRSVAGSEGRR